MQGSAGLIAWQFARNILGIFVGTSAIVGFAFGPLGLPMRIAFGAAALAILIPPHAFAGADVLDWFGLGCSLLALAANFIQSRAGRQAAAPQVVRP